MVEGKSIKLLAGCGTLCGVCPSYTGEKGPSCPGCEAVKGRPWWTPEKPCAVYACLSEKALEHHGECPEFPCDGFVAHYDPSNPEGQSNAVVRVGVLAYWRRHGLEKTLELQEKLGERPTA